MKITIDKETCVGCGLCAGACPDRFEMNDSGIALVKAGNCSCDLNEVAAQCPVNAIHVE